MLCYIDQIIRLYIYIYIYEYTKNTSSHWILDRRILLEPSWDSTETHVWRSFFRPRNNSGLAPCAHGMPTSHPSRTKKRIWMSSIGGDPWPKHTGGIVRVFFSPGRWNWFVLPNVASQWAHVGLDRHQRHDHSPEMLHTRWYMNRKKDA